MKSKGIWKSRSETTDSQSAFLASTCALTIGLNLGWLTDQKNITETDRLDQEMVFYAVAVPWAYFCGRDIHKVGPYRTMVVAVCTSVLTGGAVALMGPCSYAVCLYSSRALQGLVSASLAVSVPIFVVESAKGLYHTTDHDSLVSSIANKLFKIDLSNVSIENLRQVNDVLNLLGIQVKPI
ncbi:Major facilitator superfamily domain [Cinara cedri]|uniref:Major facilitator superfamily domain n=1 Tax=Cinara cedri TaxID=506608 RepID=A0A5E4MUK8_9HEMI|nr:Major facilitator superfamily domain [Cinara cedri]